jgi:hypothetical protein
MRPTVNPANLTQPAQKRRPKGRERRDLASVPRSCPSVNGQSRTTKTSLDPLTVEFPNGLKNTVITEGVDGLSQVNPSRPPEDEETIRRGREAFKRQQFAWNDWMAIGDAFVIGQTESMLLANTNKPEGKRYQKAIDVWLIENGFKGLDKSVRSRLRKCCEYRDKIEKWRATLTESERFRYNHPNTVYRKWEKSRLPGTTTKRKSTFATLKESVQRLEEENADLKRNMQSGALKLKDKLLSAAEKALGQTETAAKARAQANTSRLPEPAAQPPPDIALYLPADMPADALKLLNDDIAQLEENYGLRCVWAAPLLANNGESNV